MELTNKHIAAVLTLVASHIPPEADDTAMVCVYREGAFSIKCRPTRDAVLAVAEKYRKGVPSSWYLFSRDATVQLYSDGRTKQARDWGLSGRREGKAALAKRYRDDPDLEEIMELF